MFKSTTIDLIRHGEPIGGHRLRGAQDDPLSPAGWEQMHSSVGSYAPWNKIVTSPLLRCKEFAFKLGDKLKLDVEIREDFREISFGAWEGMEVKALMKSQPEALRNYWQDPDNHTPENGEKMSDFVFRVHSAWDQLVKDNSEQQSLLVCHGGVIRAILTRVLGMPNDKLWNIDVPYANVSRLIYHHFPDGGETAQLKFHQSHFPYSKSGDQS